MFHVKHGTQQVSPAPHRPRTRISRWTLALAILALPLLAGCAAVSKPTGWAAPVLINASATAPTILVQTQPGTLTALMIRGDTASLLWTYPLDDDDISLVALYATPIVHDGTVLIASYSGLVVALDAAGGRPTKSWPVPTDTGGRIVATPAYDPASAQLVVATETGHAFTIDALTGTVSATHSNGKDRVWGALAITDGRLHVADLGGTVHTTDLATDQALWEADTGPVAGDLVVDGDLLLVGAFDRHLHALELQTNAPERERWSAAGDSWFWARSVVDRTTVYAATVEGTVYAFDRATGAQRWEAPHPDIDFRAGLALAGETLLAASRDGHIYGLDPRTGAERWSTYLEGERFLADPLVLDSGVIYLNDHGDVLRIDPTDGTIQRLFDRE